MKTLRLLPVFLKLLKPIFDLHNAVYELILTDGTFETGAYRVVPSKLQNPTILGQGGPSSTQCSNQ